MRGLGIGEGLEFRRRNAVANHEILREILRAFELRGGLGRSEDAQSAGAEGVDDTRCQRRFRADQGEVHFLLLGEIGKRADVGDGQVLQFLFVCGAGIAGRDVDDLDARRLGQSPGQRMFAAAGADDE